MTLTADRRLAGTSAAGRVFRLDRTAKIAFAVTAVLVVLLAYLPFAAGRNAQNTLTTIFIFIVMASLWNLLAGYAGLVSFGQQAYVGVGAYALLVLVRGGVDAYVAVPIATLVCLLLSVPLSYGLFRTRGAYFAIATWVVAETIRLLIITIPQLGVGRARACPSPATTRSSAPR